MPISGSVYDLMSTSLITSHVRPRTSSGSALTSHSRFSYKGGVGVDISSSRTDEVDSSRPYLCLNLKTRFK